MRRDRPGRCVAPDGICHEDVASYEAAEYRLLRHHFPLALATALTLLVIYWYVSRQSEDVLFIWSMATAYVAIALRTGTLLTGPINVLRGRRDPVSTDRGPDER